jgi:hypothetical protein
MRAPHRTALRLPFGWERGFVCDFGNHLFVTDDRTRIPPGSMFASLDRTLLKCGSKALTSADDQHLVGAPWIFLFRCGQFSQAFSPAG